MTDTVPPDAPQTATGSPTRAAVPQRTVHPRAIARNVRRVTARGQDLVAVVKGDGYGHGATTVARIAVAAGAVALGTATLPDAVALRDAGIDARVLCWLHLPGTDFAAAARRGIEVAVGDVDTLAAVADAGRRTGTPVVVHLHVDTGMAREGAEPDHWQGLVTAAVAADDDGTVVVRAVMGHVPNADRASASRAAMLLRLAGLAVEGPLGRPVDLHLGGTPAAFAGADLAGIAVRVGAALVGIGPTSVGLEGAMTLTAPVVAVRRVHAGTPVGYDGTWVAPIDGRLAVVPVGYADGVPRGASGRAAVLLGGQRMPVVGRVNMDQLVVDVGTAAVRVGDVATVFGPDGGAPSVQEWADWAGTNPHEILTGLSPRLRRTAERGDAVAPPGRARLVEGVQS
ncbi:alanine racemase [Curtobacterium sp. ISL-83]|uniref:alanine racemase n=1 Tax=Curtobacterium sp. ISL-83 TaxID=2819145 RepID=UPI001BEA11C8|nr:alanine racemase [Curtobacterium sp. ISL-83]MBT2501900.1 alanine racemase [Curtobacterium sp. ISL-83]